MKLLTAGLALFLSLSTLSAGAAAPARAKLVSQRLVADLPGTPILVCRYAGPTANYEIVASTATCARYLFVP